VIGRSVAAVLPEAVAAGVTMSIADGQDPVDAELDPDRVEQAVRNLLENAIHSTPAGGTIQVAARWIEGGIVRITVDDSGPGFPTDLLTSAFDPFVRRSAGDDREPPDGTGLGLAIVRAVAQAHGGSARAENLAGGARVVLDLRG
jgi:signal transduction histidine kinase